MSIIISELNESLGKSFLKQANTYLKGKSTIDEYTLGTEMSEDLSDFMNVLKCSEKDVVYLSEDDVTNKSRGLYEYIMSNIDKPIRKIKLADEETEAKVYAIDNCVVIVVDHPVLGQSVFYNSADEAKLG